MKKTYLFEIRAAALILFLAFSASVFSQTPQYYNSNTGTSSNSFPFNMSPGKALNTIVLPGEFSLPTPLPSGMKITKVYFRSNTTGSRTYTNLHILLAQDVITTLTSGQFYSGAMDTVYFNASATIATTQGQWVSIELTTPYNYDPTKSLIMFAGQCGFSGTGFSIFNSTKSGIRRVWSVGGCPFAPYASGDGAMCDFGVDVVPAGGTTIVNRAMFLPVPGVNSNYVAIPYNAAMTGFQTITIESWVKCGGSTTANTVLNKGAASFDYQLGISASTMLPFFRAGSSIATATGLVMPVGVWTHLAVTYDGTNAKFYKDGVLVTTVPMAMTLGSSTNEMRIGRGNADAGSGGLDELRLWSVARTQAEISANMCNKWIPNNTTGLKAKWHMDSTFTDSVNSFNGSPMGTVTFDTATVCTPVAIKPVSNELPMTYVLSQNYPNPFNPTTMINFSIPKSGYVEINVFDITGRKISTLVSDPYTAGSYSVEFKANNLASGVYFYTITAGDFTATKKMLLIK